MSALASAAVAAFGPDRLRANIPLAPLTTFRVGGPAEWLIETRSSDEIARALQLARDAGLPVTLLGGGSNVLVSDRGVRGLVIRPRGGEVRAEDDVFAGEFDDHRRHGPCDACDGRPVLAVPAGRRSQRI